MYIKIKAEKSQYPFVDLKLIIEDSSKYMYLIQ